ncbi:MAG: PAS domain-containing hybrid sensor histidine kinase/response regulator [Actinobacteria bacterium]|nr:MAG: PAS domain-containing hybrid sensor histidine kinase/response regulator [Actinomycetota bacterium]
MTASDPLAIALLALAIVRVAALFVFAEMLARSRTAGHVMLVGGWLLLAAGPLAALWISLNTPLYPSAVAAGLTLVVAGALSYFRPIPLRFAFGASAAAGTGTILASLVSPALGGIAGTGVQAFVSLFVIAALLTGRATLKKKAPVSYNWLIAVSLAGAAHALGFVFIYPGATHPLAVVATAGLSLIVLLYFLRLEGELAERALVESTERFRATFEQAAVGIAHVDPDRHFVRVNQRFCDQVGYSREELLGGLTVAELTHPDDRADSADFIADIISGRVHDSTIEKRYLRKDGSAYWGSVTVSAVRTPDGDLDYLIAVIQDANERKALEVELVRYRTQLEQLVAERTADLMSAYEDLDAANRAKSDFLAKMSHELRTPLNSIIGFTAIMLAGHAGSLTEEQTRQLSMVKYSGEHLLSLVNDILDIERIESGNEQVLPEQFDLCLLLDEVCSLLRPLAAERGLTLAFACEGEILCTTDRLAVRQIMLNIVGNAIKFTDLGSIEVRTHVEGETLAVDVRDTGRGIAPEDIGRIFEPFTKGSPPQQAALEAGTGLGLSIARSLAGLLGGRILVTSTPGVGSTFTLELPREFKPAT